MSFSVDAADRAGSFRSELRTFNLSAQQWGTWLAGYPWQYFCTGTYRHRISLVQTETSLRTFFDCLRRGIGNVPIPYAAVRERRSSGLGLPAIPAHWHFMFTVPEWWSKRSVELAKELWERRNGRFNIRRYDPSECGAFYTSKLAAGGTEFEIQFANLDRLRYAGPQDMYEALKNDPYVPEHVKHLTCGETLVLRNI